MSTTYNVTQSGVTYVCTVFTTADGSFTWTPPAGVTSYDVLVVAGGGSGGNASNGGGGGGAGGLIWLTAQSCTPGVGITGSVGAGGATQSTTNTQGNNGTNSVFGSNTAVGGGGGAAVDVAGSAGGSGGGGAPGGSAGVNRAGGSGTAGQGSAGGAGFGSSTVANRAAGGGGGAGGVGGAASSQNGGAGGTGSDKSAELGTSVGESGWFASGGGGGSRDNIAGTSGGAGPIGGGGDGKEGSNGTGGTAGQADTGGGGGGGGGNAPGAQTAGFAGGSGVVIVRYTNTIVGGTATETDTALAGTPGTQFISGGMAAVTATVVAGVVLAGALVSGGTTTQTSTVQAGTVVQGQFVAGGTVTQTSTAPAGTVIGAALVAGGTATQTSTVVGGSIAQAITGGTVTETDTAQAGMVLVTIHGGTAVETITVYTGSTGGDVIVGSTASELNTALAGTIYLSYGVGDTSNRDDGIVLEGTADVVWEPAVVPVPAIVGSLLPEVRTVATVIDTAPGALPNFAAAATRTESIPALRERVLIDGVDWTFPWDVPTVVDNVRRVDPLRYGSGQITIPAINPQYPPAGYEDLVERFALKRVVVQLVDADDEIVVPDYYKGFVSRVDTSGTELSLQLGGQATGRLSGLYVPPAVFRRKQDVEYILVDTLRDAHVQAHEHVGSSGIGLIRRGGSDGLTLFTETLAVWAGATGDPITFSPNADGVYRKTVKDTTTIHATAYLDSSLVTQSLSQDFMEAQQARGVYARGFQANGMLVSNVKTPGLFQGDPPEYHGPYEPGDSDGEDNPNAPVHNIQQMLAVHDFYDIGDDDPGEYGEATTSAVMTLQAVAHLPVTGTVDEDTWDYLFNLVESGYSLDDAREYPMAEDPRVVKFFRNASGAKIEENPDYDSTIPRNDVVLDIGGPFSKHHIHRFAKSKLGPDGGVWIGQLTFKSGLVRGDHSPGGDFTSADVMDRRELEENMRVKIPYFGGGIVVYLTGVDHGPEETTALCTTVPTTTMETWTATERRREGKSNPGRSWSGHVRSSQIRNDEAVQWDTRSGRIPYSVKLTPGWGGVMVPVGQSGIIQRIRLEIPDTQFAVILSQKPLTLPGFVADSTDPLTRPLHDFRPASRPWWERHKEMFDEAGVLGAWGTEKQPCGYDPGLKTDDNGPTGLPITGLFVEEAGFNYQTFEEPVLYLYIWVETTAFLQPGTLLRNQRTTDF